MRLNIRTKHKEAFWGYLFIMGPILQFFIFLAIPLVFSLWISFQKWDILTPAAPIGFKNYLELMKDPKFWKALYNTFYLMIGIPISMVLSLILALMLNRKMPGVSVFKVLYYIPAVCSVVAVSQMFLWLFNADNGLINTLLYNLFKIQGPYWFGEAEYVKIPMIAMGIWSSTGPNMLFFLAGLQNIPSSYYEAAIVDGANSMQIFRKITLPLLTPTIFFLVVMGVIGGLQGMAQTYVMFPVSGASAGGPEFSAATVIYYLWQSAFRYYQMGYASAIAWVVGLIIFILTLINFRMSSKWVYTD